MNKSDNVSRSTQNADGSTSNISTIDVQQRLRLAAHILANGAIRAALKQQANRAPEHDPATPQTIRQATAKRPNNADLPDVNNSDITVPNDDIDAGRSPSVIADKAIGFSSDAACNQK